MRQRVFLASLALFWMAHSDAQARDRKFERTPGYIQAESLATGWRVVVDTVRIRVYDALEGAATYSKVEEGAYEVLNTLHIESTPATIRRRLLFSEGDTVDGELLVETERNLRREEFLADGFVEVRDKGNGHADIGVTAVDQWTTTIPVGVQRLGGEWIYWVGVLESNVLGTGQKVGGFFGHYLDRESYWLVYDNRALFAPGVQLSGIAMQSTDGYKYEGLLQRLFLSNRQEWAWKAYGSWMQSSKSVYLDMNDPGQARDLLAGAIPLDTMGHLQLNRRNANALFALDDMVDLDLSAGLTWNLGTRPLLRVGLGLEWKESWWEGGRYRAGPLFPRNAFAFPALPEALRPRPRKDVRAGLQCTWSQNEYKTVSNLRNLKWRENFDVGLRFSAGAYKNVEALGAGNGDHYLTGDALYTNVWEGRHFFTASTGLNFNLTPGGEARDGWNREYLEYQWKPAPLTSTFLSCAWTRLFAADGFTQLVLGDEEGMNAYPNRFFTGRARLLAVLEQRFFTGAEFATAVPAMAAFVNAGNTFPDAADADLSTLHYAAGLGLRFGMSRSTQKLVNHVDLAWPLDSKYRSLLGPTFSIRAKLGL